MLLGGSFVDRVNFGGGVLTSAGALDIFVAKFDPTGAHVWSKRFGDAEPQDLSEVTTDAGAVLISGRSQGAPDFGSGPLVSAGANDAFLVKLDATGGHVWSKRFGDAKDQSATGVAAGVVMICLVGEFDGVADFGGGPITSYGGGALTFGDVFIGGFSPAGGHLFSGGYGDAAPNAQRGTSVAIDASGSVIVTGTFGVTIDFGAGPHVATGVDVFVVKLAP